MAKKKKIKVPVKVATKSAPVKPSGGDGGLLSDKVIKVVKKK